MDSLDNNTMRNHRLLRLTVEMKIPKPLGQLLDIVQRQIYHATILA